MLLRVKPRKIPTVWERCEGNVEWHSTTSNERCSDHVRSHVIADSVPHVGGEKHDTSKTIADVRELHCGQEYALGAAGITKTDAVGMSPVSGYLRIEW